MMESNTTTKPLNQNKMKKLIREFHNQMIEACHPIEPYPVYVFMAIALIYGVIKIVNI
jgi:hypothetical protein